MQLKTRARPERRLGAPISLVGSVMGHTLIGQFWVHRCDVAVLFAARAHRKFSWLVLSV
jgi:hypothetical protein